MRSRLAALGVDGVRARTFHASALQQLHYFGRGPGGVLPSKALMLRHIANTLPRPYRFRPAADIATEIEWAKNRRIPADRYEQLAGDRRAALPPDLMGRVYREYEAAKGRPWRRRLRGPTRALHRHVRRGRERPRAVPLALPGDHGRRVPGRQSAAARVARAVVGPARGALRRRRRLPGDLRLHGRVAATTCSRYGIASRRGRSSRSSRTIARRRRCSSWRTGSPRGSAARRRRSAPSCPDGPEPTVRPFATRDEEISSLVGRIRELTAEGVAVRRNGDPLPAQRPLGALGGGARRGGDPVSGARRTVPRASRGASAPPGARRLAVDGGRRRRPAGRYRRGLGAGRGAGARRRVRGDAPARSRAAGHARPTARRRRQDGRGLLHRARRPLR